MNIYITSRTDDTDYDEYDAFMVIARSPKQAIELSDDKQGGEWEAKKYGETTRANTKIGIVFGNFNAG